MRHAIPAMLFLLLGAAAPALAETTLDHLAGEWSANGWVTVQPDAGMEPGRCRVRAAPDDDGQGITARGRCAVAAGSGTLVLRFVDDGGGRIRAGFATSALDGVTQMAGTLVGGTLQLASREPYAIDGALYVARSTVVLESGDRFSIREWNAPAGSDQWRLVTDLTFLRNQVSE